MNDAELAKAELKDHSICICKDGRIFTDDRLLFIGRLFFINIFLSGAGFITAAGFLAGAIFAAGLFVHCITGISVSALERLFCPAAVAVSFFSF